MHTIDRILFRTANGERVVVDPADIYLLEAVDGATHVRGRSATPMVDVRELHEVAPLFEPFGFLRVHREFAVNLRRVTLVRPRSSGRDWELKMEPPGNRIVPISRDRLDDVWQAFGMD